MLKIRYMYIAHFLKKLRFNPTKVGSVLFR